MKKAIRIILLALILAVCLVSCRQASSVIFNPNQPDSGNSLGTYAGRFEYFWRALNSHYVFWDLDSTDWDGVLTEYLPKFEQLDEEVKEASAEKREEVLDKAFRTVGQYYKDATKTLTDHHMNIRVFDPYREGKTGRVRPAEVEISSRDYFHDRSKKDDKDLYTWTEGCEIVPYFAEGGKGSPADGYKTKKNLMEPEEIAVKYHEKYDPETEEGGAVSDNVVSDYCIAYDFTVDKQSSSDPGSDMHVLYLAMSNYYFCDWISVAIEYPDACPSDPDKAFSWKAAKTVQTFFCKVAEYYNSDKLAGIILDNRGNGGGYNADLYYFLGFYIDEPVTVAYSKYKEGFGKTDYSAEVPYTFAPQNEGGLKAYYCDLVSADIPYVVLCDLNSVSNGEITTAGIQSLSNGYVIGERTWGGTGPLMGDPEKLTATYGGTFGDEDNGPVYVYTSTWNTRTWTKDGYVSIEGKGVIPDEIHEFRGTGAENFVSDVQTMLQTQVKAAFSHIVNY